MDLAVSAYFDLENIEKVLERGEKIELLVDKTDQMQQAAFKFEKSSKRLKNAMWWKNCRMKIILGLLIVGVILIIVAACGGFSGSKKKDDDKSKSRLLMGLLTGM